ncbi:MAG: histone deacetylase [Deltaproteobacteria bacterium]|nr:MAG: histone deacetylase [Deltaproteobacteria bacterium]
MSATPNTAVLEDPRYRDHAPAGPHPESPDRLRAVARAIAERADRVVRRAPRTASDEEILRIHSRDHLAAIRAAVAAAPAWLDPDTYVSERSLEVARLAAGGAIELARAVVRGEFESGFAAIRPPGHHAEAARAMGFCLFNNVAVVARDLQHTEGLERILILDWDVHHGNGSQHSFEDDPSVLYVSTHQFPYYPGTGDVSEAGVGRGLGATVNIPLPAGCGDADYIGVLRRLLVPIAQRFRPEVVLVSCGFDAHRDDPLASMQLTRSGFEEMTRIVRGLAADVCGGRLVFLLEGGYAERGLYEGTGAVLDVLLASPIAPLAPLAEPPPGSILRRVIDDVARVHGGRHPDLGTA